MLYTSYEFHGTYSCKTRSLAAKDIEQPIIDIGVTMKATMNQLTLIWVRLFVSDTNSDLIFRGRCANIEILLAWYSTSE